MLDPRIVRRVPSARRGGYCCYHPSHLGRVAELEMSQEGDPAGCVTGRLSIHYPFGSRPGTQKARVSPASRLMVGTAHIVPQSNKNSCSCIHDDESGERKGTGCIPPDINEIFLSASAARIRRHYFEDRLSHRIPGISNVRENSRGSPITLKARDSHSVGRSVGRPGTLCQRDTELFY